MDIALHNVDNIIVSVAVVSYNQEKYIETAISSILSQKTSYSFEILVGDDASSDRTPEIINRMAEENPGIVIPVLRQENVGAGRNGYELLKMARGKYLASCDGDDCWCDDDRLQSQVDFLETHPNYAGIYGRVRLIDEDGNPLPGDIMGKSSFFIFDNDEFAIADFEKWLMPGHSSAMLQRFNRVQVEKMEKLFLSHPTVGDRQILLYCLSEGLIRCIPDVVSCYRVLKNDNHFMAQYERENLRDQDVHMMSAIEEFAWKEYGIILDLEPIKKERFVAAICAFLRKLTSRNWKVVSNILAESKHPLEYWWILLKTILLKKYYWHILHKDIRIEF